MLTVSSRSARGAPRNVLSGRRRDALMFVKGQFRGPGRARRSRIFASGDARYPIADMVAFLSFGQLRGRHFRLIVTRRTLIGHGRSSVRRVVVRVRGYIKRGLLG